MSSCEFKSSLRCALSSGFEARYISTTSHLRFGEKFLIIIELFYFRERSQDVFS